MMTKISKTKEYAARYLKEIIGMNDEDISKEIQLSIDSIKQIFQQNNQQNENVKTVSSKANSFISQTSAKGVKNVTIMTEGASRMGDDKPVTNEIKTRYKNCIHKARE